MTPRVFLLLGISSLVLLPGCTSTTIIYNYGDAGKPVPDTVFVVKPPTGAGVAPGPAVPGPGPGGATQPLPPDTSETGAIVPGRWSSVQALTPGTARLETIVSTMDSLVIYRVLENRINGRLSAIPEEGPRNIALNPETWRDIPTGECEYFITLVVASHETWLDVQGSPEVLRLETDGVMFARFTLGSAAEVTPVQLPSGGYEVSFRFPTTAAVLRELATRENTSARFTEAGMTYLDTCSADNVQNFRTFFDVYVIGDGTKASGGGVSALPGGVVR